MTRTEVARSAIYYAACVAQEALAGGPLADELAEAGVTVIGPKTLAESVTKMREGPLDTVTRADGLPPDIEFRDCSPDANLDWIHRRDGQT